MYAQLLPCITWNRLGVNGTEITDVPAKGSALSLELPEGWTLSEDTSARGSTVSASSNAEIEKALFNDEIVTGAGPDADRLIKETATPVMKLVAGNGTLVIENRYNENDSVINAVEITVPDGVHAQVIEKFYSEDGVTANAMFQTKAYIGAGASLKLIQVQKLSDKVQFINDIGMFHDNSGRFELVEAVISGGSTYFGSRSNLAGRESSVAADMAYIVKGQERLDTNIAVFQRAPLTDSRIEIKGSLRDEAHKLTRATIDFKTGSAGSTGSETEDVLMLSENVVNKTVPLILCTEEDVEGVHGATLGRPSEEVLMYMGARGIDEKTACEMMEKARIDALCTLIEDEKTISEIRLFVHGTEEE